MFYKGQIVFVFLVWSLQSIVCLVENWIFIVSIKTVTPYMISPYIHLHFLLPLLLLELIIINRIHVKNISALNQSLIYSLYPLFGLFRSYTSILFQYQTRFNMWTFHLTFVTATVIIIIMTVITFTWNPFSEYLQHFKSNSREDKEDEHNCTMSSFVDKYTVTCIYIYIYSLRI